MSKKLNLPLRDDRVYICQWGVWLNDQHPKKKAKQASIKSMLGFRGCTSKDKPHKLCAPWLTDCNTEGRVGL